MEVDFNKYINWKFGEIYNEDLKIKRFFIEVTCVGFPFERKKTCDRSPFVSCERIEKVSKRKVKFRVQTIFSLN